MDKHSHSSTYREKLIEHLFIGELLKLSWRDDSVSVEISKPEVDSKGYDLIIEKGDVLRHTQLKTCRIGGKAANQKIHVALAKKQSGCVIWIYFDEDTLDLGPFLFFGSQPGSPLPDISSLKIAKHTKGNQDGIKAERPDMRVVPKSQFIRVDTIGELYAKLL